jgi:hypothetical protein
MSKLLAATALTLTAGIAAANAEPSYAVSDFGIWSTIGLAIGVAAAMWWFKKLSG